MPNKRKSSKLATKMLISGKMNSNKDVISTLKLLEKKSRMDNEDINFDYENVRNDFGRLEENDDDTKKLRKSDIMPKFGQKRRSKKSKDEDETDQSAPSKKLKTDDPSETKASKKVANVIMPKKSQKNKYFFIAHPEAIKKKDEIFANQEDSMISKFVIDTEKIKLNKVKKLRNLNKISNEETSPKVKQDLKGKKQIKKGKNQIWSITECSESSSPESDSEEHKIQNNENSKPCQVLELNDIDKSFRVVKVLEK